MSTYPATQTLELVVACGKALDLVRSDDSGKLQTLLSVDIFDAIRSLAHFRFTGSHKDYFVIGSDSGSIVILDYNKVHQETFVKSGSLSIVPSQYIAVDPKGCTVMIVAAEKQKLVYVLNRDCHKKEKIVYVLNRD